MERRVVTDGEVFRAQYRGGPLMEWQFYPDDFKTREAAQALVDDREARDRRDDPKRWEVV